MGGFPGKKKKLSLSNELQLAEETPPFPHSLCLLCHPAHSKSLLRFFFFQAHPFCERRKPAEEEEEGGATAAEEGWLVSPSAQKGEETSGHVELSYVLTCPSPPSPLDFLFDTEQEGEQESRKVEKKGNLKKASTFACHQVLKAQKLVGGN